MDSPIVTATWQAGLLAAVSNILAQLITCYRNGTAYTLDTTTLSQFLLFSVLACPPNCVWQTWLEAQFPAYETHLTSSEKEAFVDSTTSGHASNGHIDPKQVKDKVMTKDSAKSAAQSKQLSIRNTATKFALDQTVGAAVNTILFIAGIALIRGQSIDSIKDDLADGFWPMIFAGQKLWPVVSILSFTVIPLEYRMLFGNTAGLFWNIYLSLMAGSKKG